jgi:hypothetical protein
VIWQGWQVHWLETNKLHQRVIALDDHVTGDLDCTCSRCLHNVQLDPLALAKEVQAECKSNIWFAILEAFARGRPSDSEFKAFGGGAWRSLGHPTGRSCSCLLCYVHASVDLATTLELKVSLRVLETMHSVLNGCTSFGGGGYECQCTLCANKVWGPDAMIHVSLKQGDTKPIEYKDGKVPTDLPVPRAVWAQACHEYRCCVRSATVTLACSAVNIANDSRCSCVSTKAPAPRFRRDSPFDTFWSVISNFKVRRPFYDSTS